MLGTMKVRNAVLDTQLILVVRNYFSSLAVEQLEIDCSVSAQTKTKNVISGLGFLRQQYASKDRVDECTFIRSPYAKAKITRTVYIDTCMQHD